MITISDRTRKQHFVPQFYLKRFTNTDNKFYAYDFKRNEMIPRPVFYKRQCYKDYFYGEDGVWEANLRLMEGNWAATIRDVVDKQSPLTRKEIDSLKEFVLYQRQRTSDLHNNTINERESILMVCAQMICLHRGWKFDEEVVEWCKKRAEEETTPAENVEKARKAARLIDDLQVLIIHFNTATKLITTDTPVITLNAFTDFRGYGYGNIGIIFLLPLSPEQLLIVYDGNLYKKYKDTLYLESDNKEDVECVNRYELIQAEQMAFANNPKMYEIISDDILEKRENEANKNKPQFLGAESEKLIITSLPGTNYYYDLSFIHLPREWQRIPFHCKEVLPRKFERGWDEKLAMKYDILWGVKYPGKEIKMPPKTELKLGCRRMESVAKLYWQEAMKRDLDNRTRA